MDLSKADSVAIKFDGKNYANWEFQFRNFAAGERLLPIILGEKKQPGEGAAEKEMEDWVAAKAQLIV
ncbi:unnamed protein product [Linum trigynum]|uniref:Retrotransposon Copia-like N-terminal domain-containing protein n=1 Tax=Linum trigynum TaxID=586398 RepID=A0AAV2CBS3_9ROSI